MPLRKIIFNALYSFISDHVVLLNAGLIAIAHMDIEGGIKLYALIIGALYTTYKLYKDVISELRWWKAFKKWNEGYYTMIKAMLDVKRQKLKRDKNK